MSDADRDNLLAGVYRTVNKIAELMARVTDLLAREGATAPLPPKPAKDALAPTLPGLPDEDWTPPAIIVRPREWSNAVRWYDAAWKEFHGKEFHLEDTFSNSMLATATKGKIGVASYARVLSALVAANAAERRGREYVLVEPTDALREAVEAARKGGRAHA